MTKVMNDSRIFRRRLLFAVLTITFFMLLFTLPVSAEAAVDSEYGIYVAGTAVTASNASDIIGDGKASYDPATDTLTLRNYSDRAVSELDGMRFSVFCNEDTDVVILGDSNYFVDAVYTGGGDITVRDTSLGFEGTGFRFLLSGSGSISCIGSEMTVDSIAALAGSAFDAKNIVLSDCRIVFRPTGKCDFKDSCAVFQASEHLSLLDCEVNIDLPFPMIDSIFSASNVTFSGSDISVSGCYTVVSTVEGSLNVSDCKIVVDDTDTFAMVAAMSVLYSRLDITAYFNGIQISGKSDGSMTDSTVYDSRISITQHSFEDMRDRLTSLYNTMNIGAAKGVTLEQYISGYRSDTYDASASVTVGMALAGTVLVLEDCRISTEGQVVGIFVSPGAQCAIDRLTVLKLRSQRVAFLALATGGTAVGVVDGIMCRMDISTVSTEGSSLESLCDGVVTFSRNGISILSGKTPTDFLDVLDMIDGASATLTLRSSPYFPVGAWVGMAAALILIPVFIGAIFIFRSPKKKK